MNEGKGCTGIEEVAILVVEEVLADKIWRSEGDISICRGRGGNIAGRRKTQCNGQFV